MRQSVAQLRNLVPNMIQRVCKAVQSAPAAESLTCILLNLETQMEKVVIQV